MTVQETLEHEAAFEPGSRALIRSINTRLGSRPMEGEFWVRMRPPTLQELASGAAQPSLVKFYRVASFVQVAEVLPDFVEVTCSGHALLLGLPEFLETFVKVTYWPGRSSYPPPETPR